MTAQGSPQCLRDLGTPLPLRLPLGQDALVLGVQLRHVAGHAMTSDKGWGLSTHTRAVPRALVPPGHPTCHRST